MTTASYTIANKPASVAQATPDTERDLNRLLEQYRGQPRIEGLLKSFLLQCDELDARISEMVALRSLDQATGAQLDGLGQIVGRDREGLSDDDFRTVIKVQILVNASSGTPDEIIEIFKLITDSGAIIDLQELFPAEVELELSNTTLPNVKTYRELLQQAVSAGIQATLVWVPQNPFTFAVDTTFVTDTTLGLSDTGAPSTGGAYSSV